jgi:hypothetical protein
MAFFKPTTKQKFERLKFQAEILSTISQKCQDSIDSYKNISALITDLNEEIKKADEKLADKNAFDALQFENQFDTLQNKRDDINRLLIATLNHMLEKADEILPEYIYKDIKSSIRRVNNLLEEFNSVKLDDEENFKTLGQSFAKEYSSLARELYFNIEKIMTDAFRIERALPTTREMLIAAKNEALEKEADGASEDEIEALIAERINDHTERMLSAVKKGTREELEAGATPKQIEASLAKLKAQHIEFLQGDLSGSKESPLERAYLARHINFNERIPTIWSKKEPEEIAKLDDETKANLNMAAKYLNLREPNFDEAAKYLAKLPENIRLDMGKFQKLIDVSLIMKGMVHSKKFFDAKIHGKYLEPNDSTSEVNNLKIKK